MNVVIFSIFFFLSCKAVAPTGSGLLASGKGASIDSLKEETVRAIKSACNDPKGAKDVNLTKEECYLVMAGSTVRESSWKVKKSCEAWGNYSDPCCGLTQSRRGDAKAVGLSCNPHDKDKEGYKCNVLTGLRNLRCKADGGKTCDKKKKGRSLKAGIYKHLGGNFSNRSSYIRDMKDVYNRKDIRKKFGIKNESKLRKWDKILEEQLLLSKISNL